jgi:hypothetical protein
MLSCNEISLGNSNDKERLFSVCNNGVQKCIKKEVAIIMTTTVDLCNFDIFTFLF